MNIYINMGNNNRLSNKLTRELKNALGAQYGKVYADPRLRAFTSQPDTSGSVDDMIERFTNELKHGR